MWTWPGNSCGLTRSCALIVQPSSLSSRSRSAMLYAIAPVPPPSAAAQQQHRYDDDQDDDDRSDADIHLIPLMIGPTFYIQKDVAIAPSVDNRARSTLDLLTCSLS